MVPALGTLTHMSITLLDKGRAGLAKAVRDRIAGSDFENVHARIWYTPGERWFTESDAIWRVHADTSMFIGGIRALLLQSLHPVAMLAVSEHSGFRGDPWGRLQRTSKFLATTTYGCVADAEQSIRVVQAIHKRVTGLTPDGMPYRADDARLLGWIHVAEVDSFLASYQTFGASTLEAEEADQYVRQSGFVAQKLGVLDPPQSVAELQDLLDGYRPELEISAAAKEAAEMLLKDPPLSGPGRIGYAVLAAGAISILPSWARAELSLPTLPVADRLVVRPLARSAMTTLRWALTGDAPHESGSADGSARPGGDVGA
jgi:uncharacterized protein (DUF2236 family)